MGRVSSAPPLGLVAFEDELSSELSISLINQTSQVFESVDSGVASIGFEPANRLPTTMLTG